MASTIKTNKMLWGRAASRCSLAECRRELVIDAMDTDDPSLVGEAAHIVAEEENGPRGISPLTHDQRNKYENLILLCNVHHKQVDDQTNYFTVERLHTIKSAHEGWVRSSLTGFDSRKQTDDERWAGYIEEWEARADLDDWLGKTSFLMGPTPAVSKDFMGRLQGLQEWILSRVWPRSSPAIQTSLENFRMVASDLVNVFREHVEREARDDDMLYTEAFYKTQEVDQETYDRLLKRFEFHVDLVHDLTFELTRAANYVCDQVRENLDHTFRVGPGVLLVIRSGGLNWYTHRTEYTLDERAGYPYPGLDEFMNVRSSRDHFIGKGRRPR